MVLAQGLLLCAYTVTTIAVLKRAGWITYVSFSLCLSLFFQAMMKPVAS